MANALGVSEGYERNLRKLAEYLKKLPQEEFHMANFSQEDYPPIALCGSVGCAVGHGPRAGLTLPESVFVTLNYNREALEGPPYLNPLIDWGLYTDYYLTAPHEIGRDKAEQLWSWLFSGSWADTDNTPMGAALRILWALENGVPHNALAQCFGYDPLCYFNPQLAPEPDHASHTEETPEG